MAVHVFKITELRTGSNPGSADDCEVFEWTADRDPSKPFDGTRGGGARACPVKPWTLGGSLRTVRTDYPGALDPSEQVMGPTRKPFTLSGRFDDRYNGEGFALATMKRFEAMCRRGRVCRFEYGPLVREGLITDWDFPIQRIWDIDYTFTVSVHRQPDEGKQERAPESASDPFAALEEFDTSVQAMLEADALAPRGLVTGTLADDVTEQLVATTSARDQLAGTIENRDRVAQAVDAYSRVATQFRAGRAAAYNMLLTLAEVRSDLDMATTVGAMSVLNFEDWIRSLRFAARIAMGRARAGDLAATEHAEPSAVRLYRPSADEHLYAIARKFYGTPHAWKLIYDRNALQAFVMDGTETLIIPERGGS